jgi:transcriptional regulator with XRE-family HTH domain
MTQKQLAELANMAQPRISAMEQPGETAFNIETLVRLASAFKVGLKVEFVGFSEMLAWENNYSQDEFDVVSLDQDNAFLNPQPAVTQAAPLKSYQWRDVEKEAWPEQNVTFLCIGDHGKATFSTTGTGSYMFFKNEQPLEATGPAVSGEVDMTVLLPAIHSQLVLEGIK